MAMILVAIAQLVLEKAVDVFELSTDWPGDLPNELVKVILDNV